MPPPDAEARPRSHVERLVAQRRELVRCLKAKDASGRWAWYALLLRPHRARAFDRALREDEAVELEEYGTVLLSCYGEGPSDELRRALLERYGLRV